MSKEDAQYKMVGGKEDVYLYALLDPKKVEEIVRKEGMDAYYNTNKSTFLNRNPIKTHNKKLICVRLKSWKLGIFFQSEENPDDFMCMWGIPIRAIDFQLELKFPETADKD